MIELVTNNWPWWLGLAVLVLFWWVMDRKGRHRDAPRGSWGEDTKDKRSGRNNG